MATKLVVTIEDDHGNYATNVLRIDKNYTRLNGQVPTDMGERYRLDTAARMLAGLLGGKK